MSNYMLHFALVLHVPQALSLLLRMSQKVGSCRLHRLTVCLNITALALVSKVTTDFNASLSFSVCVSVSLRIFLSLSLSSVFLCLCVQRTEREKDTQRHRDTHRKMSNYIHFALVLHICSLPQALSLLLRMSQKVGSCRLHRLTVCLNITALALVSKVTTDFNVVAELRS